MKKTFLSVLWLVAGLTASAQREIPGAGRMAPLSATRPYSAGTSRGYNNLKIAKTTGILGDTLYLYNNADSLLFQSSALYGYGILRPNDSGFVFGQNAYGDNEFAEYFHPGYGGDTSIDVIGVYSAWGGTMSSTNTQTITFNLWTVDTGIYSGNNGNITWIPGSIFVSSQQVPLTALNLSGGATVTYFNTPVPNIFNDFFLGYSISYNFSADQNDTIGLRSTPDGTGQGTGYYEISNQNDTAYYSQNAVRTNGGVWLDAYVDLGLDVNLSLLPIYKIDPTTNVKGITKNNLTVFSCSPNPAVNSTNISYSLQQNADVTIQIIDAGGKTMTTINQPGQGTGAHMANVSTENWPAGNYVYIARTSTGAAIASQLTVLK